MQHHQARVARCLGIASVSRKAKRTLCSTKRLSCTGLSVAGACQKAAQARLPGYRGKAELRLQSYEAVAVQARGQIDSARVMNVVRNTLWRWHSLHRLMKHGLSFAMFLIQARYILMPGLLHRSLSLLLSGA